MASSSGREGRFSLDRNLEVRVENGLVAGSGQVRHTLDRGAVQVPAELSMLHVQAGLCAHTIKMLIQATSKKTKLHKLQCCGSMSFGLDPAADP